MLNYGLSKRAMMRTAKSYMARDDLMYRHIVPVWRACRYHVVTVEASI